MKKKLKIQARLPIGITGINKAISYLSKILSYKLNRLMSDHRSSNWAARKLVIIFLRRRRQIILRSIDGQLIRRRSSKRLIQSSIKVPLASGKREKGLVNFWHEQSRYEIKFKILDALKKDLSKRNKPWHLLKGSYYIQLVLSDLKQVFLHSQLISRDYELDRYKDCIQKMDSFNIPLDPYLPLSEEQRRILAGLPLFRQPGSKPGALQPMSDCSNIYSLFSQQQKTPLVQRKLRQSKLTEHFQTLSQNGNK